MAFLISHIPIGVYLVESFRVAVPISEQCMWDLRYISMVSCLHSFCRECRIVSSVYIITWVLFCSVLCPGFSMSWLITILYAVNCVMCDYGTFLVILGLFVYVVLSYESLKRWLTICDVVLLVLLRWLIRYVCYEFVKIISS